MGDVSGCLSVYGVWVKGGVCSVFVCVCVSVCLPVGVCLYLCYLHEPPHQASIHPQIDVKRCLGFGEYSYKQNCQVSTEKVSMALMLQGDPAAMCSKNSISSSPPPSQPTSPSLTLHRHPSIPIEIKLTQFTTNVSKY